MCDRLQDGTEGFETNSHIKEMGSKEEWVVDVTQGRHHEVPYDVEESLGKWKKKTITYSIAIHSM